MWTTAVWDSHNRFLGHKIDELGIEQMQIFRPLNKFD